MRLPHLALAALCLISFSCKKVNEAYWPKAPDAIKEKFAGWIPSYSASFLFLNR